MRKTCLVIGVLIVGALAGCTQYIPHSLSMGGIGMPPVEVIGNVEGISRERRIYLLMLPISKTGDYSLKSAVADALSKRGGDTLLNVTRDDAITRYPFLIINIIDRKTVLTGTAVRFKKQ